MSDQNVPLFPLNTVLFPRMPLPLHVFEERYKRLVKRCVEKAEPFGVVLIREGSEVGETPEPMLVGTLAQIHAVNRLDDGRMNILTVGTDRFQLLGYAEGDGEYLVGQIRRFADDHPGNARRTAKLARDIAALFGEYFHALVGQAGIDMPEYDLPTAADELSFVVAAVLQLPNTQRQALLELTDTCSRLAEEHRVLSEQLDILREMPKRSVLQATPVDLKAVLTDISRN